MPDLVAIQSEAYAASFTWKHLAAHQNELEHDGLR
jgi:hypothetical protein